MKKGIEKPVKPEITLSDVMEEIKDLVEVVDIIHSEISNIKIILKDNKKPVVVKPSKPKKEGEANYMHG
jgi:RIO-like serine/threonine protein kinase